MTMEELNYFNESSKYIAENTRAFLKVGEQLPKKFWDQGVNAF